MDELLAKAAEAMGMPEAMVKRSAEARAKAEGKTPEEVLAEWAGVEAPAAAEEPEPAEPAAEAETKAEEPAREEPAEKPPATGIDRFVEMAAEKMDLPASMVRRSAEARARAEGRTFEEVLADWAEVDVGEVQAAADEAEAEAEVPEPEAPAAAAEPSAAEGDDAEPAEPEEDAAEEEPEEPEEPSVEVIGGDDEAEPAADEDAIEEEPAAAGAGVPRWLAYLFVIVPAFAIGYAAFFPNGPNCGDAGRLAVDPATGVAVECDGSPFGERITDFFAIGGEVYATCQACHGSGGGGTAAGPAFVGELLATFPEGQCETHVEWVRLGSPGWPESTYGATDKPVGGFGVPMPGFGGTLSEEELRSVVLYERVRFGDEPLDVALADCGLVDADNDDEGTDAEAGTEPEDAGELDY